MCRKMGTNSVGSDRIGVQNYRSKTCKVVLCMVVSWLFGAYVHQFGNYICGVDWPYDSPFNLNNNFVPINFKPLLGITIHEFGILNCRTRVLRNEKIYSSSTSQILLVRKAFLPSIFTRFLHIIQPRNQFLGSCDKWPQKWRWHLPSNVSIKGAVSWPWDRVYVVRMDGT
jgi:hypothetical protein